MVENKKKKLSTMNVDKTIEKQRLILDNLNEILKISPFVIDFIDKVSYQESLTKKFLGKTFFNGASSFLCSFASVCFAQQLFDRDLTTFEEIISVLPATLLGTCLLQKENRKNFIDYSLDTDELYGNGSVITEKFSNLSSELMENVADFVNDSHYTPDEILKNKFVNDIFQNNSSYINDKIYEDDYVVNFDLDNVNNSFNSIFGYENGFGEFILRNCNVFYEEEILDEKSKVRKR